jgi:putative membrane protein
MLRRSLGQSAFIAGWRTTMSNEGRDDLARDRTDFAEDRTILAHERSFAGWIRTGMAAVGIGLGFNALFGSLDPTWVPKTIATAFLVAAAYIFVSSGQRAREMISRLDAHVVSTLKPMRIRLLAWFLTLLSLALALAIWLLIEQ